MPREELMGYIWNSSEFVDDNILTVNVTRMREKLASIGALDMRKSNGFKFILYRPNFTSDTLDVTYSVTYAGREALNITE